MITHYFKTVKDESFKTLDAVRSGVWTHVIAPEDAEIAKLVEMYALDDAILKDAQDFFEVPRIERSGGMTYFFTRYPYDEKQEDSGTAPLLIVMGESFLLTCGVREVPQFEPFFSNSVLDVFTTQKTKLFIRLMLAITHSYERDLVRLRKSVQKDRAHLRRIGSREIEHLVNMETDLNDIITALVPTNSSLQQIVAGNYMQLFSDDQELMQDLLIANNQLIDSARSVLKTIQNIRNAAESILTNRLNLTIRTLTILTIILTIPTIVASLYGMNVPLPLSDNPHAFWMVLAFIVTAVLFAAALFKRHKWL
jgi:magnesium transporter